MAKMGRPRKEEEITLDQIMTIMLAHAAKGGFLSNLPAEIYLKTDVCVSHSYLDKIKDQDFIRTKDIAKGLCSNYWTEQMHQAGIPAAVWTFIQKNVSGWRDMKDVKVDSLNTNFNNNTEVSPEEAKKELERLKIEIAEKV